MVGFSLSPTLSLLFIYTAPGPPPVLPKFQVFFPFFFWNEEENGMAPMALAFYSFTRRT
jgi:hypothetical protein